MIFKEIGENDGEKLILTFTSVRKLKHQTNWLVTC